MEIDRVVVVGGGIAGLAAAAVLARRAGEVVLVERHPAPALPPQAGLPHAMLLSGALVLNELFPGLDERLRVRGAVPPGPDPTHVPCHWAAAGAVRHELRFPDVGRGRSLCSRELIQQEMWAAVERIPNVRREHDTVTTAVGRGGAVHGVALRSGRTIEADLVIDAGGRGRGVPTGVPDPPVTEVGVDIRYTSFLVERQEGDLDGAVVAAVQHTPRIPRMGIALPMEGGLWQVGFGAFFGEAGPTDPAEVREYAAAAFADPVLAQLLDRPFLDRPRRYTFRSGLRRHWERMARPVPGFVAVGDTVASVNPIYGQGMSSALLQVRELGRLVDRYGVGPSLAAAAPTALAKIADAPWHLSTGADFTYARTTGPRPRGQARINAYVSRVLRAAAVDDRANLAFTSVTHLMTPPAALFAPPVVAAALRHGAPPKTPADPARAGAAA